ncbi:putative ankyrin repeat protein RF_0381 [Microplitis demolitor]|uniref:putative ankyrin repeat protein RF_0381 n=1 Tax=Microplitis demolitor TaxID=69319 RepID=UPI0004CD8706|nr:putative ankyrin repeat protein RF_0381 [Microplitis demolitor]XP_008557610.1 putative ankyrin repeat protein RF_0381 [Microplitis demolitor]
MEDIDLYNLLRNAITYDDIIVVEHVLGIIDVNIINKSLESLFDLAIDHKRYEIIKILVINVSEDNFTPEIWVKLLPHLLLIQIGAHRAEVILTTCLNLMIDDQIINQCILYLAVKYQLYNIVEIILQCKVDVNLVYHKKSESKTPLLIACQNNDLQMVRLLLGHGADPNVGVFSNSNFLYNGYPIHTAIKTGNLELIEELINHGVDLNHKYKYGRCYYSILRFACGAANNLKIIKLLVERGADVNSKDNFGLQPICHVLHPNSREIFKYFIECQNLKLGFKSVESILNVGVQLNYQDNVYCLFKLINNLNPHDYLRYQIDGHLINNNNSKRPVLHLAARYNNAACIDILVRNDADVNLKNKYGRTPLHVAFRHKNYDFINNILKYGANINVLCNKGHLPLEYIISRKLHETSYGIDDEDRVKDDEDQVKDGDEDQVDDADEENQMEVDDNNEEQFDNELDNEVEGFLQYIVKMKALNLYVSDKNYKYAICKSKNPFEHRDVYLREIEAMKNDVISNGITYYDIVKADVYRLVNYLNNRNIFDTLKDTSNYDNKFPQYADIISGIFQAGFAKKKLLDAVYACPIFDYLFQVLPYTFMREMIEHFDNLELRDVINKHKYFQ